MDHRMDAFDIGADMVIEIVEAVGPIDFEATQSDGVLASETRTEARTRFFLEEFVSDGAGEQGPTPEGDGAGPSVRP